MGMFSQFRTRPIYTKDTVSPRIPDPLYIVSYYILTYLLFRIHPRPSYKFRRIRITGRKVCENYQEYSALGWKCSNQDTVCPKSPDPLYIPSNFIDWIKTSWKYCTMAGSPRTSLKKIQTDPYSVTLVKRPLKIFCLIGMSWFRTRPIYTYQDGQ